MAKKDYYIIEKNVEKVISGKNTDFLDINTFNLVRSKLRNINYEVFYPYKDAEKVIIYVNNMPQVKLLEIITNNKLRHKDIMGSLYGLGIDGGLFGDIIVDNTHYYIIIFASIYDFLMNEFKSVGKYNINLKEVDWEILDSYERKYEELEFIVSSLRIDTIVARIIGTSRDSIKNKFMNDEVFLNYNVCHRLTYNLKEGDIFSIRKYGKYKFMGVIRESKKGNYVIRCNKYIDN